MKDIQELAAEALKDRDAFYNRLAKQMEKQYRTDIAELKNECVKLRCRNGEIDDIISSLYADKAKGILSEKRFVKLMGDLEEEQAGNETRLQELSKLLSVQDAQESDIRIFINELSKAGAITELNETILNRLIDKIIIGEVKVSDGEKVQEVKIVYNFVGEVKDKE